MLAATSPVQYTRTKKNYFFRAHKVHVHAKYIMLLTKLPWLTPVHSTSSGHEVHIPCFLSHTHTHTHTRTGRASLISQHVARTLEILRNQLLHHQFQQAAATMETVAMVMDHVPEIVRKVGTSVIMSADVYVWESEGCHRPRCQVPT